VNELDVLDSIIFVNMFFIFCQPTLVSIRFLESAIACAIAFHIQDTDFQVTKRKLIETRSSIAETNADSSWRL
jgi:hypothetical protein